LRPAVERVRLLILVVVFSVLACSPGGDTANGGLGNTSWTVISIGGQDTIPEARPTMTFDAGGTVSGSTGCNQYSGQFHTDGDRIAFGPMSSTLMGCEDPRAQQEAAFLSALGGAATWRLAEGGNLLIDGAGEIVAAPGVAEGPPGAEAVADRAGTA
jgi:heat shock protein HslJ